jgi:8-oxo-dGTP pyrophosphatase MutT (NUDIX family)
MIGRARGVGPSMPHSLPSGAPAIPVAPRLAASLLVVRNLAETPEVLMGLRGASHRFMPNKLVFPGGAVDPEDSTAAVDNELSPHVRRRLHTVVGPPFAKALAVAAARELEEETGLALGRPPRLAAMDYLCRAVTPAASPVRFDAHFFVVDIAAVSGDLSGSGELEDLRYYPLPEALALDLAVVTRGVVEQLIAWLAMTPAERAARRTVQVMRERIWQAT